MTRYGDEIYPLIGKKKKDRTFQEFVLNILDKRVVRFSLPINYFPAYHSNTLATLMATQYRFRKQTRIRHGPYVLHSQLVSLGSRTTDYRVIKFKKVVNCPGKSQLSERAVNYDNNPCKIGDTHDCIVSRRTPWNRADRVTVSTRGLKLLASVTGSWDSEPWKKNDNACFACTQSTPTVLSLFFSFSSTWTKRGIDDETITTHCPSRIGFKWSSRLASLPLAINSYTSDVWLFMYMYR